MTSSIADAPEPSPGAVQHADPACVPATHSADAGPRIVSVLDDDTRRLVRLSAVICAGDEETVRAELARALEIREASWVEELILQSYLFAGLPRALNAMRDWRRVSGRPAPRYGPPGPTFV